MCAAIVCLMIGLAFSAAYAYFYFAMIQAINSSVEQDHKVSAYFSYTGKFLAVQSRYRNIYPEGRLAFYAWASAAIGAVSFVMVASILDIINWPAILSNLSGLF
jgi:hypothetical protein